MVLVDTSVWIQHFREGCPALADQLSEGLVLMHPFVIGELVCGNLKNRSVVLSDLYALPSVDSASNAEVHHLVEQRKLWGRGLGWVDAHLLASAILVDCGFWTLDKRLREVAQNLGLTAKHGPGA